MGVVNGYLHVKDRRGFEHRMTMLAGGFEVDGKVVTLVVPRGPAPGSPAAAPQRTASGSIATPRAPAQVAKASRILVEGIHDAELVEKVWGDDLRGEGVVVEQLDGADHLDVVVRGFAPREGRRLGILLDHLVDGSKETRIAASVAHPHVLVTRPPLRRHLAGGEAEGAGHRRLARGPTRRTVEGRRAAPPGGRRRALAVLEAAPRQGHHAGPTSNRR